MKSLPFLDLGRDLPHDDGPLATACVALLYSAIYLKDVASTWIGMPTVMLVLGIGLAFGTLAILTRGRLVSSTTLGLQYTFVGLAVWLATLLVTGQMNLSAYYVAIPCAFVIAETSPRLFFRLLAIHMLVSIALQAFEYATNDYVFVFVDPDGIELDVALFGGAIDILRAKGLFQGPLSAVAFALWMAFFARGQLLAVGLLFLCAFFASGRLGMVVACVLMLIRLAERGSDLNVGPLAKAGVLAFVLTVLALVGLADQTRLEFILSAFDLTNDQNLTRFFFWLTSVDHYLNYSPASLAFGDYGFIFREEGGTENDFLRVLLDNGLVCLLLYLSALAVLWRRAKREIGREPRLVVVLVVLIMNLFPFAQSLGNATLFWLFVLCQPRRLPVGAASAEQAPATVRIRPSEA